MRQLIALCIILPTFVLLNFPAESAYAYGVSL